MSFGQWFQLLSTFMWPPLTFLWWMSRKISRVRTEYSLEDALARIFSTDTRNKIKPKYVVKLVHEVTRIFRYLEQRVPHVNTSTPVPTEVRFHLVRFHLALPHEMKMHSENPMWAHLGLLLCQETSQGDPSWLGAIIFHPVSLKSAETPAIPEQMQLYFVFGSF